MAVKNYKIRFTKDNRKVCLSQLADAVNNSLYDIGDYVVAQAQERVPIDTGALRDSIMKDVDQFKSTVTIGSPLEYAPFVELGTGPWYEKPPNWMKNLAKRGHHLVDPWWYMDDDGEWKQGWFVHPQPYLKPAIIGHATEIKRIFKDNLEKDW